MARKQYKPTDFRNKAEFGAYESVPNQFTGVSVPKFVPKFTLHYKPHTNGVIYNVDKISPDENFGLNRYDFVTLKKSEKVGK